MLTPFQKNIQILPIDIQNHILSYTYSPQPQTLLEDIQNYSQTKQYLYEIIEETETQNAYYFTSAKDEIHNELCNFIYYYLYEGSNEFLNIYFWSRNIMYKKITIDFITKIIMDKLCDYSIDSQINILWGLLNPAERNTFLDLYITEYSEFFEEEEEDYDF